MSKILILIIQTDLYWLILQFLSNSWLDYPPQRLFTIQNSCCGIHKFLFIILDNSNFLDEILFLLLPQLSTWPFSQSSQCTIHKIMHNLQWFKLFEWFIQNTGISPLFNIQQLTMPISEFRIWITLNIYWFGVQH